MHIVRNACIVVAALAFGLPAHAQTFPSKPISLTVTFAPGGGADISVRALAKTAEKHLGQPIVVQNKPAGGGAAAMQEVAKSAPDGYALVGLTAITAAIAPHMRKVPYDGAKDFTPIMNYGAFNTFIAVRADSSYKTLDDLLAFAAKNPRVLTVGISVIGASSHLGVARIANERKIQPSFVPFGGGAPAVTALLGRHVTAAVVSGEVLPHVRTGEVRLLGTLMSNKVDEFPQVPTIRDLGFGWDMLSWLGVGGPAGLAPAVTKRLEEAFLKSMDDAGFQKVMTDLAIAPLRQDASAAAKQLSTDVRDFGELIKSLR
ncbi:MAG: tripartite tricarboxylate transporter substrate binding protein, partial [Alphaproteobacteria bacterium]|nr:tripartite tricarboxylate transporter substrate binding protein [Alphaproteobacteria bacterium]